MNGGVSAVTNPGSARQRAVFQKMVVILPALDESATIADVIGRIPMRLEPFSEVEIIVVDDGSTDDSAAIAEHLGATVIRHGVNLGVGAAFQTGIEAALGRGADVIVNMDADGQFRPEDIPELVQPIVSKGYGFVTCTRFADPEHLPKMPRIKILGNRLMVWLVRRITGVTQVSDVSCGFRAYDRDTAMRLTLFGNFTYTQESFIELAAKRVAMTEVAFVVRGEREHGESRVARNLWRYAFHTSAILLRALRDWKPLAFFGSIAVAFLAAGLSCLLFVSCYWVVTARTSPWTSLITLGGISCVMGIGFLVLALIADQIGRGRRIQEQLLYLQRRSRYGSKSERTESVA